MLDPAFASFESRIADLDSDGDGDIAMIASTLAGSSIRVYRNAGDSSFETTEAAVIPAWSFGQHYADVNEDGLADLPYSSPAGVVVSLNQLRPPNRPPIAVASVAPRVECTSPAGAEVALDGTASTDPDSSPGMRDDIASFEWFEDAGGTLALLGSGETLSVTLPLGPHALLLKVTDRAGASAAARIDLSVVDTTPPDMALVPSVLWPPNHRLVQILVQAADRCGAAAARPVGASSSEPDDAPGGSDGATAGDAQLDASGDLLLRAERDALDTGRTYTVDYRAMDSSGNEAVGSAGVTVPHNLAGGADPLLLSVSLAPAGTLVTWTWLGAEEVGAVTFDIVRGELGQVRQSPAAVNLGWLVCIEGASEDRTTAGHEDAAQPPPGQSYFYLVEYREEATGSASSFGEEAADRPRGPAAGGCR